ncbi:hypothetical protein QCE80_13690, partial [Staphylococcus aureus]|nr:hypothetical protein [Staphylococcus aureus]
TASPRLANIKILRLTSAAAFTKPPAKLFTRELSFLAISTRLNSLTCAGAACPGVLAQKEEIWQIQA